MREFTLDEKDAISKAFDAGNYANAYETLDLEDCAIEDMPENERASFVLGFFSSYALDEIFDRETFDMAYWSDAGQYVVNVAGYCDTRTDEYEQEDNHV